MTRWVLADYGEVISGPLPAETIGELAGEVGEVPRQVPAARQDRIG